jgi:nucleoside-diphosphate-sugar epimerase
MNKKLIITGAGGFIGSELTKYFLRKGYEILAFVHNIPVKRIEGVSYRNYDLNGHINDYDFSNASCLIHCAFMKNSKNESNARVINIQGTKELLAMCRKHLIKKFIFLSSISAHEKAKSDYGKSKYEIENILSEEKDLIIKAGLVIGNGGIYFAIERFMKNHIFVPVINSKESRIYFIQIEKLMMFIEFCIERNITGKYILAEKEPINQVDFYKQISEKIDKKRLFLKIPFFLLYTLVSIIELLQIPIGITRENLLGLKHNKTYKAGENVFYNDIMVE